jgi:hypothetical protein
VTNYPESARLWLGSRSGGRAGFDLAEAMRLSIADLRACAAGRAAGSAQEQLEAHGFSLP